MSYSRDSGAPAYGDANTNVRVDFVFGNMPLQPNDDRGEGWSELLGAGDSHSIALTEWNSYPLLNIPTPGSRNYMITGAKFVEGVTYEYTSQNNLKVGDEVSITGCGWLNQTSTVVYANANKFRVLNEIGTGPELTGLYGRVDVINESTGRTLEGGDAFYWPSVGLCNTWGPQENRLETVKQELIACGVPPSWLTDAQWTGGDHSYDDENGTYDINSGRVFYYYVAPGADFGYDANNVKIYGADMDGTVIYGSEAPGVEGGVSGVNKDDFYLVVFQSQTPGLETADWL